MKWLLRRPLLWVGALLLLPPGASRADFYTNWSFAWHFNPVGTNGVPGAVPATTGTGSALFAAESDKSGGASVPVALVSTSSSATTVPDTFQHAPFTFAVKIIDNATHASGTLTFDGHLNGALTATKSAVVGTFSADPGSPSSLSLGGHTFRVSIAPQMLLPAPGALPKLLNATVLVDAAVPPPPTPSPTPQPHPNSGGGGVVIPPFQSAPEPSSFALAGIAAAVFGLARRRRSPSP